MEKQEKKKVLVLKICCIGDLVQATPSLRALKKEGYEVHYLCVPWARETASLIPFIDRLYVFNPKNAAEVIFTLIKLRMNKYNVIFNFHRDKKSYIFCRMLGAEKTAGFIWKGSEKNMDITVPFDPGLHETDRYLSVLKKAGIDSAGEFTEMSAPVKCAEKIHVDDKKTNIGLFPGGGKNPGTVMNAKRWPPGNFSKLAKMLKDKGYTVYLFGGDMDVPVMDDVREKAGGAESIVTGIRDFAYYVSKMDVFVASDTGPLHIAAALGIRTIGLYGPSSPGIFGARGKNSVNISENISCSPCYEPDSVHKREFLKCKENMCMKNISVSKVEKTIMELLGSKGRFCRENSNRS